MPRLSSILILIVLSTFGCARNNDGTWKAPLVYRIDIQQGNVVDQSMINKLKPGMDKKQVKFIMGTPLIMDPFHNDRWDYLYSFEPGRGEREQRRVTLYFNGEHLARIEGDIKVTDRPLADAEPRNEGTVAVPLEDDKPGFFKRLFSRNKKNAESGGAGNLSETETTATAPDAATPAEPGTTGQAAETATTETQSQPGGDSVTKTAAAPSKPTDSGATGTTADEKSTAGDQGEKNLLRRFWDRMTKSSIEADTDEESVQHQRDAEVLEKAGGDL